MKESIGLNDILAFVLELAALVLWGLWAYRLPQARHWAWPAATLAVALFVGLWALFFARTAAHRPPLPWLALGKLLMLLPAGLLYWRGQISHSLLWAALVLIHLGWGLVQGEL